MTYSKSLRDRTIRKAGLRDERQLLKAAHVWYIKERQAGSCPFWVSRTAGCARGTDRAAFV